MVFVLVMILGHMMFNVVSSLLVIASGATATVSQLPDPVERGNLSSSLASTRDKPLVFSVKGETCLHNDRVLHSSKDDFLWGKTGSLVQEEHVELWRMWSPEDRGASLPLVKLHWLFRHVGLRASLIVVAALSAAFFVFVCSRHLGQLWRSGLRVSAGDESLSACGGMNKESTSSDFVHISEELEKKVTRVLSLIESLANTCEDVLHHVPTKIRSRGIKELLGSSIQELAALSGLLGDNMNDRRKAVAERVFVVAEALTLRDSISSIGKRVRNNVNNFKSLLKKVKNSEPCAAQMAHEKRMSLLSELLELQLVGFELQISAVKNVLQSAMGDVQPADEELQAKMRGWGAVVFTRRLQIFSVPTLSDWLRKHQKSGKTKGLLLKPGTAERLKQAGIPDSLSLKIQELHTAAALATPEVSDLSMPETRSSQGAGEAKATAEMSKPSNEENYEEAAFLQAIPQSVGVASHPSGGTYNADAARLQPGAASSFSLQLQEVPELSGPLIGLPFAVSSVLGLLPPAPSSNPIGVLSEQPLCVSEPSQQPSFFPKSKVTSEISLLPDSQRGPGVPRAPHHSQAPFKGHPLGEPYPREASGPRLHHLDPQHELSAPREWHCRQKPFRGHPLGEPSLCKSAGLDR